MIALWLSVDQSVVTVTAGSNSVRDAVGSSLQNVFLFTEPCFVSIPVCQGPRQVGSAWLKCNPSVARVSGRWQDGALGQLLLPRIQKEKTAPFLV